MKTHWTLRTNFDHHVVPHQETVIIEPPDYFACMQRGMVRVKCYAPTAEEAWENCKERMNDNNNSR